MSTPSNSQRFGFLGAGQMATALARGWINTGLLAPTNCFASDVVPAARDKFLQATGGTVLKSNSEVVAKSDVLILAVKPQSMPALLNEIHSGINENQVIISIAAGITLKQLADGLLGTYRVIRVMPNTPCLIGASAAGFSVGPGANAQDALLVERLFNSVGKAFSVPENLLDAVTGLSGSGPAFVYMMIEAMADGGVRMGLPRDIALSLATQTVLGSARMVQETQLHPAVLKDSVASPGGTTIAGMHALEKGAFRACIMNAVEAAARRATELGK